MSGNNENELQNSNVDHLFEELEEVYRAIAQTDQAPIAKLGLYATTLMQYLKSNQKLFNELRTVAGSTVSSNNDDETWYSRSVDLFAGTLEEAVLTRKIRAINTRKISTLFLNSIIALTVQRIDTATSDDIEDDVRDLMDLYLNGLIVKM